MRRPFVLVENEFQLRASLRGRNTRFSGLMILQRSSAAHTDRADEFAADDNRHPPRRPVPRQVIPI